MRILQINSDCGVGSTGRIATDLCNILEQQGHECLIAYGRDTAKETKKSIKIGTKINNYLHVAKTRFADLHGFGSKKATQAFLKMVKEYNPDIIHLHNIHGYYINIELLFNFLAEENIQVVWTLHDCWAFTGHCAHFDYVKCEKWKTGCYNCPQKKSYPSSLLFDNSEWNFQKKKELFTSIKNMTIITPSIWLADIVKKSFLSTYTINVINNGIDLDLFRPIKSNFRIKNALQEKFILLGCASIWSERKGLKYFIDLSEKLNDNYKIILLGITKKQKKKLPKSIIGIEKTNNIIELAEIYSSADLFINSTLEDNFPTTNLEALACGTPVITFNTGGSAESIDRTCGIIVEKGNLNELIRAIEQARIKPFLREACVSRSMLYNKNARFNDYVEIYIQTKWGIL